MTIISGIQQASGFVKNSKGPLDKKTRLSTADRLALTNVQRDGEGMVIYDTDLKIRKILINDPAGDTTTEADWEDFATGGGGSGDAIEYTTNQTYSEVPYFGHGSPMMLTAKNETLLFANKTLPDRVSDLELNVARLGEITQVTYAELEALKNNNELVVKNRYELTDFATIYNQSVTGIVRTGAIERLLLTPTSTNTFAQSVYSLDYPTDIIRYDFDNNLCEDGITPRKGKIIYRKNTLQNLSADYDFMNVKFRRFKVSSVTGYSGTWFGGMTYKNKSPLDSSWGVNGVTFNVDASIFTDYYTFSMLNNPNEKLGDGAMRDIAIEGVSGADIAGGKHYNNIVIMPATNYGAQHTFGVTIKSGCTDMNFGTMRAVTLNSGSRRIILDQLEDTAIEGAFVNNYGHSISHATLGFGFASNTFESINESTIWHRVTQNKMKQIRTAIVESYVGGLDLEAATVLQDFSYNKTIYKRPDGTEKVKWYDDTDSLRIEDANF